MLQCHAFPCFWLSAVIQPWTTGSSCEPADCQGESNQWITASHCTWQYSNISKEESMNKGLYLPLSGSEKARPVHRVVLLQHPEAGHQPPAEVFKLLTSSHCRLAEILQPTPPPPVLRLQRLWGSALPPQRGERHVAVEAEVWAPRPGFSSHRRYSVTNKWKKVLPLNTTTSKCIFWGFQMPSQQWVHSLWKPMSSYSELLFFFGFFLLLFMLCSFCLVWLSDDTLILPYRVIDKSMKNFKAFFRWLYVGKKETLQLNSHSVSVAFFLSFFF